MQIQPAFYTDGIEVAVCQAMENDTMKCQEREDFQRILEAPLLELFCWTGPALENKVFTAYLQTLIGYFSRDLSRLHSSARALRSLIKNHQVALDDVIIALRLNRIRRSLLSRQLNRARILCEKVVLGPLIDTVWGGEFLFLFARLHEFEEKNIEASDIYKQASLLYEINNCHKKSLRSYMNSLVCQGREGKEEELLPQYVTLYEQSSKTGDDIVASTCCHNISVTLLTLGACQSSLAWANKAIDEVNNDTGSLNYFQCLLHRADTLLKMKRPLEARRDIEEALISEHPTIQGAASILLKKLVGETSLNNGEVISPGWKRRETELAPKQALTELEDKLIGFLISGSKSRNEIIAFLWNESVAETEFLNDRFKQILKRLRKKFRYPIRQKSSLYFIDFSQELECKGSYG